MCITAVSEYIVHSDNQVLEYWWRITNKERKKDKMIPVVTDRLKLELTVYTHTHTEKWIDNT